MKLDDILKRELDSIDRDHLSSSQENPIRDDAFDISDSEKVSLIEGKVRDILETLGMDLTDDSIKGTPLRVAKMYVNEIFGGLNPKKKPIPSTCEHHLLPIVGLAHVAYISNGTVVGLSKINRIVNYYSKRPQVQERLTIQIVKELQKILNTDDVACVIDAKHLCVNSRGINDVNSSTVTAEFGGKFKKSKFRRDFLDYIKIETEI